MDFFLLSVFFVSMFAMAIFGMVRILKKHCWQRYERKIIRTGVESKATLLSIEQLGDAESVAYRLIRLKLQVNRENERNYVTEVDQKVHFAQLQNLKIGGKVRVKYDPKRPKQVLLICETGPLSQS